MSAKTILFITGGNTGLGLEIIKSLSKSPNAYHIIMGTRTLKNGQDAISSLNSEFPATKSSYEALQADLSSDESLTSAIDTIASSHGHIDVLINNGGANFDKQIQTGSLTIREAWLKSWDTNVAGTQVLTTLAVPLLLKSQNPRLLFMTSGTSTLTETQSTETQVLRQLNSSPPKGWPKEKEVNPTAAYRSSKCGLNMLMREWTRVLGNDGVKVWAVSPGFLATGLGGMEKEKLMKVSFFDFLALDFHSF